MNKKSFNLIFVILFALIWANIASAQTNQLIKRTTYKTETVELGVGGTVTIIGAPNGSITLKVGAKMRLKFPPKLKCKPPRKRI